MEVCKLKRSTGISNLVKPDGNITESDEEKAELLNSFFSSVFTKEDTNNIPSLNKRNNNQFICDTILTRQAVQNKLNKLDTSKSTGPDKIPALILKTLSLEISLPLTIIYNKSLEEGTLPKDWKVAEVTGIFKKGSKSDPGNYRPVSLTSIICKVLESFVKNSIQEYMETNKFFTDCQHGFRGKRSCVTQLLEAMNDFTNLIDNSNCIDVIYMDFAKAFDKVPHQRLLNKMSAYGIEGNLLKWISSFLSERCQRVKVNNSYSSFSTVNSGIPQGSVLGPLLFVIFINDLPENVFNLCKIFADDTKIYNDDSKHEELQRDLLALLKWSDKWQLKFNSSKCSVLHIGRRNKRNVYYMDQEKTIILNSTESEKDVGVTFTENFKFDKHIGNIVNKANQMTGIIKRSFSYLDVPMFTKLFKSIVRPHLEYANVIWHPVYKKQQFKLECVQRRATKILKELKDFTYSERLKALDLPSIKYRQIRADLIQSYKILHDIDNIKKEDFFELSNTNITRNSHHLKLFKPYAKSMVRSNFLPNRIIDLWNKLSPSCRDSTNMLSFKKSVDFELSHLKYEYYS